MNKELISYRFSNRCLKLIVIILSILINVVLLSYSVYYQFNHCLSFDRIIWDLFIIIYIAYSTISNYFLAISKDVFADNENIYFLQKKHFLNIKKDNIIKMKRVLYYYYRIDYLDHDNNSSIYFFISPNPPFSIPSSINLIKKQIRK